MTPGDVIFKVTNLKIIHDYLPNAKEKTQSLDYLCKVHLLCIDI